MNSALIAVQVQALGNLRSIEAKNAPSPRTVEEIQAAYKLVDEVAQGGMRFWVIDNVIAFILSKFI